MYDTSHADEFVAKGGILECDLRLEQKIIGTSRSPTTPREKNSRKLPKKLRKNTETPKKTPNSYSSNQDRTSW